MQIVSDSHWYSSEASVLSSIIVVCWFCTLACWWSWLSCEVLKSSNQLCWLLYSHIRSRIISSLWLQFAFNLLILFIFIHFKFTILRSTTSHLYSAKQLWLWCMTIFIFSRDLTGCDSMVHIICHWYRSSDLSIMVLIGLIGHNLLSCYSWSALLGFRFYFLLLRLI